MSRDAPPRASVLAAEGLAYAELVVAKLLALVLPLGLDTFALAAALGVLGTPPRDRLRLSLTFSAFEAAMPLVGLALGAPLGHAVGADADYLAIGVLMAFGLHTLLGPEKAEDRLAELARRPGRAGLLLGISVSLDELAIGFTLGLLRLPAVVVIVLIAVQAFVVAQLGLCLGSRLSSRLRERAESLAGVALTGLGVTLLAQRVLA